MTSSWGGTRYLPYAFTEQGIYMLMTVLKGDLATKQSKSLIRLFKKMKDYLVSGSGQLEQQEILSLAMQTQKNTDNIQSLQEKMKQFATKNDLAMFMKNFMEDAAEREYLFLAGQVVEASVAYGEIYAKAQKSIYIVDNYIGAKTLLLLKNVPPMVNVIIFSDNLGRGLTQAEYDDFKAEYPHVQIALQQTRGKYHDRFIMLDYGNEGQQLYHCGGSSKDGGKRVTAISPMDDMSLYQPMFEDLLQSPALMLR